MPRKLREQADTGGGGLAATEASCSASVSGCGDGSWERLTLKTEPRTKPKSP